MPDVTAKHFDEMEAALGGVFVRARAELGVGSFGLQVINLPPHFDEPYAEHAHEGTDYEPANHGQEEVYVPLSGRATLVAATSAWSSCPAWPSASALRSCATSSPPTSPSRCSPSAGSPARPTPPRRSASSAPAIGRPGDERQAWRMSASPAGVRE